MKNLILIFFVFLTFIHGCDLFKEKKMNNIVAADIGAVQNFSRIQPNIAVSGQPNEENLKKATESGYKTIINLRPREEWPFDEESLVKDLGMNYVLIPISTPESLTFEKAKELQAILHERSAYPVLIHCGSSNRVGALYALYENLEKRVPADKAIEIGKRAGMTSPTLEERVRFLIENK